MAADIAQALSLATSDVEGFESTRTAESVKPAAVFDFFALPPELRNRIYEELHVVVCSDEWLEPRLRMQVSAALTLSRQFTLEYNTQSDLHSGPVMAVIAHWLGPHDYRHDVALKEETTSHADRLIARLPSRVRRPLHLAIRLKKYLKPAQTVDQLSVSVNSCILWLSHFVAALPQGSKVEVDLAFSSSGDIPRLWEAIRENLSNLCATAFVVCVEFSYVAGVCTKCWQILNWQFPLASWTATNGLCVAGEDEDTTMVKLQGIQDLELEKHIAGSWSDHAEEP